MSRIKRRRRRLSTEVKDQLVPNSSFGICVIALAAAKGVKPAEWLAELITIHGGDCTPRHANRLIAGKRAPSLGAILAIVNEIRGLEPPKSRQRL